MVKTYVKKPVEVKAIQYTGNNVAECLDFIGENATRNVDDGTVVIHTLEGDMICSVLDFVIKGVNGEFYPCKHDIFAKTYEEIKN